MPPDDSYFVDNLARTIVEYMDEHGIVSPEEREAFVDSVYDRIMEWVERDDELAA